MKSFILSIISFLIFPSIIFAQANYHKGYIIKNNGDTVKGYVNYKEWGSFAKKIMLKREIGDKEPLVFRVSVIKKIEVTGFDSYFGYIGPISNDNEKINYLTVGIDTTVRQDTILLKVLADGTNAGLLYYYDNNKRHFFITEHGGFPYELIYHQYILNNQVVADYSYRKQLLNLVGKYYTGKTSDYNNVYNAAYNEEDLSNCIKLINNNNNKFTATSIKTSATRFFIGAGAVDVRSTFTFPNPVLGPQTTQSSISPIISFGFDFLSNANIQKSFFRIEAKFLSSSGTFRGNVADYTFTQYKASVEPQLIFNLYNTDKLKYFLGGGIGISLISTPTNRLIVKQSNVIIDQYDTKQPLESIVTFNSGDVINKAYSLDSFDVDAEIKTGVLLNKKIELYIAAVPYSININSYGAQYKKFSSFIGFNYLFGAK